MATTFPPWEDNAKSTLAASISNVVTSITVATGEGANFPDPAADGEFKLCIFSSNVDSGFEFVWVTARATDVLTVTRGYGGTSGTAWSSGANIRQHFTDEDITRVQDAINDIEDGTTVLDKATITNTEYYYGQDSGGTARGLVGVDASDYCRVGASTLSGTDIYDDGGHVANFAAGKMGIGLGSGGSPDGTLHVHTATAGSVTAEVAADDLVVEGSGDTGVTVLSGNASTASVYFGDDGDADIGRIVYDHSDNSMRVYTNAAEAMAIASDGDVDIAGDLTVSGITTEWNQTISLPDLTAGSPGPAAIAATSIDANIMQLAFDPSTNETAYGTVVFPDTYDGRAIRIRVVWMPPTADTVGHTVRWLFSTRILTDDTAIPSHVYVVLMDAFQTVDRPHVVSGTTTPGGASDGGNTLAFYIRRDATTDTYTGDAELLSLEFSF